MKFGAFFVGQRPLLHEQYADESKINPNPVSRTDVEVYEDILRGAELAEELGFDSVWIAEHAFSEHSIISSPHSLLAAIAAKTKRVKVGVACTIVPWHAPLRMAQDLATLDIISQGRLIVGAGRGYQKREFDIYGLDIAESRGRFHRRHGHRHQVVDGGHFRLRRRVLQLPGSAGYSQAGAAAASSPYLWRSPTARSRWRLPSATAGGCSPWAAVSSRLRRTPTRT